MENDQNKEPDFSDVKTDAKELASSVKAWIGALKDDAEEKVEETKIALKEKQEILERKADKIGEAGGDASDDLKEGFKKAYAELKRSFKEAKDKFDSKD